MENHVKFIRAELEKAALNAVYAQSQVKAAMERLTELEAAIATTTPDEWAFVKLLGDASYHFALDSGGEDSIGYLKLGRARDLAREWDPERIRELGSYRPSLVDVERDIIDRIKHDRLHLKPTAAAGVCDFLQRRLRDRDDFKAAEVLDKLQSVSGWRGGYYAPKLESGEEAAAALFAAFIWDETPGGEEYWNEAYTWLLGLEG